MRVTRRCTRRLAVAGLAAGATACSPTALRPWPVGERQVADTFGGPLVAERWWELDGSVPAARFDGGALVLRSTTSQTAFLRARFLPSVPATDLGAETAEALEWRAEVVRDHTYFILLDGQFGPTPFRLQLAPYGVHVTSAPTGQPLSGQEVARPAARLAGPRTWRLERQGSAATLSVDGERLWDAAVAGPLTRAAFGETDVDALHGGALTLWSVTWRRWERNTAPLAPPR